MFNDTFYPTPSDVAREMLSGISFDDKEHFTLDPSAGKGDLLDYIKDHKARNYGNSNRLFACEIVPELRSILEEKGYPVLADDFLLYHPSMYFTSIVMNPPFKTAEEHIFKAWEILGHGKVVSLISNRSLEGKNAKELLLLNMIEKHGRVRHLGQVFRSAERPTDEEISVVILEKEEDPFNFSFDPVNERAYDFEFEARDNELSVPGFIPSLVAQYNAVFGSFEDYLKERVKIEKYLGDAFTCYDADRDPLKAIDHGSPQTRYNSFVMRLNALAWEKILDHPNFQSILTHKAREMVRKFRSTQRMVDFNIPNIRNMFLQLELMAPDLLEAAIDDAFDEMTMYHKDNRVHWEGWKTDLAWKVAPKVILPYFIATGIYRPTNRSGIHLDYGRIDHLNDIDRAMCVLSGKPYSEIRKMSQVLEGASYGELIYSTFFKMRGYMKGTLHIWFRDKKLLDEFNYRAAKNKGWLPDGTQSRFRL